MDKADVGESPYPKRRYKLWRDISLSREILLYFLMLAIVNYLKLEFFQMDVKTSFLRRTSKQICIEQLIGFEVKWNEQKVYRLKHSIHGFMESSGQ